MDKKKELEFEQLNTYGLGHNCMISMVKIGRTSYIVSSYFENDRTFIDSMDKLIEKQISII